jgi:hypothetical protein
MGCPKEYSFGKTVFSFKYQEVVFNGFNLTPWQRNCKPRSHDSSLNKQFPFMLLLPLFGYPQFSNQPVKI